MRIGARSFLAARRIRRALLLVVITIAMAIPQGDVALSQSGTGSQPTFYTAIDLNPNGVSDSEGHGISGGSQAGFGTPVNTYHALLWKGSAGSMQDLNPGFLQSQAYGISGGQVVGWGTVQTPAGNRDHAVMWGSDGVVVDLDPLQVENPQYIYGSQARATSGAQQVGYVCCFPGASHAALWSGSAASFVDLHPAGFYDSYAYGVSGGQQVGWGSSVTANYPHALLWNGSAASVVDLNPNGFTQSYGYGISGGEQVGQADCHAVLWKGSAASVVDLHPKSGFDCSEARGTNGAQQVGVGVAGGHNHALVWSGSASSVVDLNAFLPSGFTDSYAYGIDADGNIVGLACTASPNPCLPPGHSHAFLWKPGAVAVIVLPGMAGSWTQKAENILNLGFLGIVAAADLLGEFDTMIANHLDPSRLVAHANYNTLVSKLQAKGIQTIVMPYDWANGGVQAAAHDLDLIIQARGFTQVDIIAHSLGGLVAQQYIQNRVNNGLSPNVRNLLMVGSPNQGAVLAHCFFYVSVSCVHHAEYGSDQVDRIVAFALQLLTKTGFNPASIETVDDLMPTFSYLVDSGSLTSQFISHPTTTCGQVGCLWDNTFTNNLTAWTVGQLNTPQGPFQTAGIKVYTANGTNLYTGLTLSIPPSTPTNVRLSHLSVLGDGTVLNHSSALIANGVTNFFPIAGAAHGGSLVDCAADVYLNIVNKTSFSCTPLTFHNGVTIVTHSPVKILLTDPLGRKTGFDFNVSVNVANIPSSLLLDGDSPGIFVTDGIPGAYQLDVVGTGAGGAFGLDIAFPNGFPNAFDTTIQEYSGNILPGQKLRFTLDAFVFRGVSNFFAAFGANLRINSPSRAFEVDGRFTLGAGGTFSPVTQPVTIELGQGFLLTIPAGSFTQTSQGTFFFAGVIRGIPLEAYLIPLGGNTYGFQIAGAGAPNLPSVANPVDVRLAVGNNGGIVSVNADFGRPGTVKPK